MTSTVSPQKEKKTGAGRFPLVRKLVHFADLRRNYREMREALIASNRQAGSYKGWVTRWKRKYESSELEKRKLDLEIEQHLADKQELGDQIRDISAKFQLMGTTLVKLEAFEAAVDHLSEMKSVADQHKRVHGCWNMNAMDDLSQSVDTFLDTVEEILQEDLIESSSEDQSV